MFTTIAFSESQDNAGAYANVAPIPDRNHQRDGDYLNLREFNQLLGALACMGATVPGQVYLRTPSMRQFAYHYVTPVEHDIHPGAKVHMMMHPDKPFQLVPGEDLEVLSNANPEAAEQHAVIIWLGDSPIQQVAGRIITIHGTINAAQVVNSWEASEVTLTQKLPKGTYKIVGFRLEGDGLICGRIIPKIGHHNPGVPAVLNSEENGIEVFRYGNMGEFCSFDTEQFPQVEILGSSAVAAADYNVYFDVMV